LPNVKADGDREIGISFDTNASVEPPKAAWKESGVTGKFADEVWPVK
jgi:hypothetical protein